MMRMIAAVRPLRPDFSFLTGWDAALMPMLLIGCDGGTNATSGVVPEITRKLYDLTLSGRLAEARDLQYRLLKLFDAMLYSAEFPEGFRAALQLRGIRAGVGRQPKSERQQLEYTELSRQLQCMLAAEGYTDEPVGGCAVGRRPDAEQVARIVRRVVRDLQGWGVAPGWNTGGALVFSRALCRLRSSGAPRERVPIRSSRSGHVCGVWRAR